MHESCFHDNHLIPSTRPKLHPAQMLAVIFQSWTSHGLRELQFTVDAYIPPARRSKRRITTDGWPSSLHDVLILGTLHLPIAKIWP